MLHYRELRPLLINTFFQTGIIFRTHTSIVCKVRAAISVQVATAEQADLEKTSAAVGKGVTLIKKLIKQK